MEDHIEPNWQLILARSPFLRLHQIIGDSHSSPPVPPLIPVSKSTWYRGVSDGRFPGPIKDISPGCALWRTEAIIALVEERSA